MKPGEVEGRENEDEDGESLPSASGAAKPKGTEHQPFRADRGPNGSQDRLLTYSTGEPASRRAYGRCSDDVGQRGLPVQLGPERIAVVVDARTLGAVDEERRKLQWLSAFSDLVGELRPSPAGKPCRSVQLAVGAAAKHDGAGGALCLWRWRGSSQIARGGIEQAKQLGRVLKVDMPGWFEATGDSYFKHVNRTTIELSVAEARGSYAELSVRAAAKKSEVVTIADRLVAGTGWIPSRFI